MKILTLEKLTREKWVNLFAATFENGGQTGRWVFASRRDDPSAPDAPLDAVVIVPLLKDPGQPPRLVMIREFRVPIGGYNLGFPAGLIEPGETIEETVQREMLEETGLEVTAIQRVTQGLYSSSGLTDENVAMAFIEVSTPARSAQALGTGEEIEVVLLDWDALNVLCNDRSVRVDAKAWMVLYLYQRLGKLE